MKIIKKILLAATLLLSFIIAAPTFADAASTAAAQSNDQSSTIKDIFDVKTDYTNDLAQKWLKQLFGSFIYTSSPGSGSASSGGGGSDVTVLSTAIGFSNVLAMIFGIVIVSYMFIAGSMNTAHHGEALGKNWSSVWLPVRLCTGFGLLMPAGSFGGGAVSTIQALTIWIILIGSNAANVLWNTISEKVSSGVSINSNVMLPTGVSKSLISMLSCTHTYLNGTGAGTAFKLVNSGVANTTIAVKVNGKYKSLPPIDYKPEAVEIKFAENGQCGSAEFRWTNEWLKDGSNMSNSSFTFLATAKAAGNVAAKKAFFLYLNEMILAVNAFHDPVTLGGLGGAEGIVNSGAAIIDSSGGSTSAAKAQYDVVSNKLFAAAANMSVQLPIDVSNAMVTSDFESAFASEIKKGGWGSAGLWFMRVGSVQNMVSEVTGSFSDTVNPEVPSFGFFQYNCISDCESLMKDLNNGERMILGAVSSGAATYTGAQAAAKTAASTGGVSLPAVDLRASMAIEASSGSGCNANSCSQATGADTKSISSARGILKMLALTTNDVKLEGQSSVTDTTGVASPFATAAAMGNMSINIMEGMYAAAGLGSLLGKVPLLNKLGDVGGGALGSLASSGMTVLFGIGTYFGAIGITLAFIVPFMPALLWMMMMIGYLLAVIEAMIASPFATIMMVTPEGEGIAGTRLEKAIMLLAMCVLRPSLMVMGLVAAITLSSVSFGIFNQFFWYTAESSITGSILTILVLVGMYTAGIFQICKHSISVMTKLPDQILEWMGMQASREFGGQDSVQAMERGVEGGTKAGGNVMSTLSRDMKSRLNKGSQVT